jgi:hypothetical protein
MAPVLLGLIAVPILASETFPAQLYEVTTETGMPHLEENLRYTITHEKHCLAHRPFAAAFPVLSHPALRGCSLQNETRHNDTLSYALVCPSGQGMTGAQRREFREAPGARRGTTGEAIWQIDEHRIRGTLNVKLGGKNMTFYQRVTALPLGACKR